MTDRAFQEAHQKLAKARAEIGKVIFGQNSVINQTLVTLVSGGHLLLIGVPGLAKTLLVDTTAKVLGLDTARVQCTPDLMPADILGSEVLEEGADGKRSFRFIKGPIFTQLLMADEINRASPRTQSALLQAMQEKEVTVSGKAYDVPKPFHVLATQNPIEQEGTYPLPEAQLDRFLMQVDVDYPARDAERVMLIAFARAASLCTTRMPRPPPPPAALISTGNPMLRAISRLCSGSSPKGPSDPGIQGMPAAFIALIASILSPIMRIVSGRGPMKTKPLFSTRSAKSAFSDRNP